MYATFDKGIVSSHSSQSNTVAYPDVHIIRGLGQNGQKKGKKQNIIKKIGDREVELETISYSRFTPGSFSK